MALDIDTVYRDTVIKGDIHSGAHDPDKAEIRALHKGLSGAAANPSIVKQTKAALDAVTPASENYGGLVLNDPDPTKNGYYYRSASAWVKGRGLPDSIAEVTLAGTANAQTGTASGVNPANVVTFFAVVSTENTGPMTLSISGETARDVVNAAGNALSAGEWTGTVLFFLNGDGDYQLLFDAGAAAAAAQSATNAAASAAAAAAFGTVNFDTVADLLADNNGVIGYVGSGASVEVVTGFHLSAQGFRYEVAASGASDEHLETAGGLKLYLLADAIDPVALGAVGYVGEVEDFKSAIGAATDDYAAIQKAIEILDARGGGVMSLSRFHKSNTPLSVPYAVSIQGNGRDTSGIFKDSATTKAVTYYGVASGTLVRAYPGALPANANAVLILGGAYVSGRWTGFIRGVTIGGTLSDPGDVETWNVEFGILNVGAIAYIEIDQCGVQLVERAMLIPALWMSNLHNIHMWRCRSGLGIENGTSSDISTCYANSCRDYGFAIRALKYSTLQANGVDFLNDPDLYADRTREATAYYLDSCTNVSMDSNGQEQTYGNGMVLDTLRYCQVRFNENIGIGSDYAGSEDIAFIKVSGALVGCDVYGNHGWDEKPDGLTFGSANPAKHHNLFEGAGMLWNGTTFHNNVVREVFAGLDTEAGWLNNNVDERFTAKRVKKIGLGTDAEDSVHLTQKSVGNSSATWAQRIRNSDGTIIWALRDDGVPFAGSVYSETTGGAANVVVGSDGSLVRSTSALKYKDIVSDIPDEVVSKVMEMSGFVYTQKGEGGGREYIGMAADHFDAAGLHWFVQYGEPDADGNPVVEGLMYDRIVAVLLEHGRRVDRRLAALESPSTRI